jgi:hypothetical protein
MILLADKSCSILQLVFAKPLQCNHGKIDLIQFVPGLGKRVGVERTHWDMTFTSSVTKSLTCDCI